MPNWTMNTLIMNDEEDFISLISKDENGKDTFSFETLIPMPEYIYRGPLGKAEEEKYGKENCWYDWSCKNWGTKWDACHVEIDEEVLTIRFDTAWTCPMPIMGYIIEHYPKGGTWVYFDEDYDGHYEIVFKDGYVINETREYRLYWDEYDPEKENEEKESKEVKE